MQVTTAIGAKALTWLSSGSRGPEVMWGPDTAFYDICQGVKYQNWDTKGVGRVVGGRAQVSCST